MTGAGVAQTLITLADGRVHFHTHADTNTWADAAALCMADALRQVLHKAVRARLLLSGGSTPGPVYQRLAEAEIDWQRIDVGLVDERWLQPDDPDSNAHLVRETLQRGRAADVSLQTLIRPGQTIDEAVHRANLHVHQPADVVALGMGEDGHTASLFPGMREFDTAIQSPHPYVAVDASGCPGAGRFARRISLTPTGLAPARTRLLLIRGQSKRTLLQRAAGGDDVRELPVRLAFTPPGPVLQVHWTA